MLSKQDALRVLAVLVGSYPSTKLSQETLALYANDYIRLSDSPEQALQVTQTLVSHHERFPSLAVLRKTFASVKRVPEWHTALPMSEQEKATVHRFMEAVNERLRQHRAGEGDGLCPCGCGGPCRCGAFPVEAV